MQNTPSRDPHVNAASEILFGDEEFAYRDIMLKQLDEPFMTPDGRWVSVNELAFELESAAR